MEKWLKGVHSMKKGAVIKKLRSDAAKGLTAKEAERRKEKYGENKIEKKKERGLLSIVAEQFKNSILFLLIVAAVISFYLGQEIEGYGIVLAIVLSVSFGTYLEYKADKSIEELSKYTEERIIVIRDSNMEYVNSSELVPGDIVLLSEGQRIPADMYIIEGKELEVDESLLTGESEAVHKKSTVCKKNAGIGERHNILYAGTDVLRGNGKAIVIATGNRTEVGKISEKLSSVKEEESELYKDVGELGKYISAFAVSIILVFLLAGYFKGADITELLLLSITLAVAAVPEGLTTVLTIILALGIKRMADSNAIVRKLATVESLGRVDIIATDKTGTITEGKVSLVSINYKGVEHSKSMFNEMEELLKDVVNATEVQLTDRGLVGNEVDVAIAEEHMRIFGSLKKSRVKEIKPFSSQDGYMSVKMSDGRELIKGAPEAVIPFCSHYLSGKGEVAMEKEIKEVESIVEKNGKKAMKVIAYAVRKGKKTTLVALLSFMDAPKNGVKETIEELKKASIAIVMITGDNPTTAKAIAKKVGIEGKPVRWDKIEEYNDGELYDRVMASKIIARATPEAKLRIVEVLSRRNVVAVTGDGVNDALALKKAQIGVVMGKRGTAVSREVADIVLLDDNFSTLTKAIQIGRNIFTNIQNFLRFQLTANASAILMIFYGFISEAGNMIFTLTPLQILWINLILDGPPALAQGFEPPKSDVLTSKPLKKLKLINKKMVMNIMFSAFYIASISFLLYHIMLPDYIKAIVMGFSAMVFFQLWNSLNCRSFKSHFYEKLGNNRVLLYIIGIMAVLQMAISLNASIGNLFIPQAINNICNGSCDAFLTLPELLLVILATSSIIVIEEIRKSIGLWTE
ncbi:MAG: cation-transporting P-type ATPase [Methanobacteriota archaeon]|nr:MAG: cation-transporting P-type ATPase [Euryarchaeota archaeon]